MTSSKSKKKYPPCRGTLTARGPLTDAVAFAASLGGDVHSAVHTPGKSRGAKGTATLDVTFPYESLNHLAFASCSDAPYRITFASARDQHSAAG